MGNSRSVCTSVAIIPDLPPKVEVDPAGTWLPVTEAKTMKISWRCLTMVMVVLMMHDLVSCCAWAERRRSGLEINLFLLLAKHFESLGLGLN